MRLIDADAFVEANKDIIDNDIDTNRYEVTLRELINEAPTAERQHGEWQQVTEPDIWGKTKYKCSVCKYVHRHSEFDTISFCENCGAEMRKEGDEK